MVHDWRQFFSHWTPAQILITTFAFLILLGSCLLSLPAASRVDRLDYLDALFTATSAVCVTGLVVVDTLTQFSFFGQLVILILIQCGGLGLMTMATLMAVALGKRISFRNRLIVQEAFNQFSLEGMVRLIKAVGKVTLFFEGLGAAILTLRFAADLGWVKAIWYGVFHSVSAFCNAGFDLFGQFRNLTPYVGDWVVNLVVMTLIIFGGLGFSVIVDLVNYRRSHGRRKLALHTRLVVLTTIVLIIFAFVFILLVEWDKSLAGLPLGQKILAALFQAVTPRTAGFNTVPLTSLHSSTVLLMITLMFIGASPGSTGGGVKTSTFSTLVLMVRATVRGHDEVRFRGRSIPRAVVMRAVAIIAISFSLVLGVTMLLSLADGYPFLSVLFEATSAFGTVGLSMGITPSLSCVGRIAVMLTMFVGRVGPMTLALALAQDRVNAKLRYPEEMIIVG